MPEGVEVKVIATQLSNRYVGKFLKEIEQVGGRFLKNPEKSLSGLAAKLPLVVKEIGCKGKFLFWKLEDDNYLFNTLGMTGKWTTERSKHTAVCLKVDSQNVYFEDVRRFGTLKSGSSITLQTQLAKLGDDMLSSPPNAVVFFNKLQKASKKTIVQFLMDQSSISGVGNYIKSEALYRAQVSPHRLCGSLLQPEAELLRTSILDVMQESYQMQGATFLTYGSLEGAGKYASFFRVYRKETDPLGNRVISEDTADKRTSWWVPALQT